MKLSISPAITTRDLRILGTSSALRNRLRRATIQMCTWVGNEQSVESDGGLVSRSWGSFTGSSGRGNTPVVAFEVSLYVEKVWLSGQEQTDLEAMTGSLAQEFAKLGCRDDLQQICTVLGGSGPNLQWADHETCLANANPWNQIKDLVCLVHASLPTIRL